MTGKKIETYYQERAKKLVDMLFDGKLFNEKVTRDHMQSVEDLIAFEYQSNADSTKRCLEIMAKIKK